MRYLSVCSGIEAASVAWHDLGWTPLAFAEIEQFPRAVLAHRFPGVPLHGDFTKLRDEPWIVDADLLVGGTPCQAFSVAGLRGSLSDERGNLTLEFVRLANAVDDLRRAAGRAPAFVVWENVPGVLSVADNAFGAFLGGLVGHDAAIEPPAGRGWSNAGVVSGPRRCAAWRVLDAQHFGVPQRRRRVFVTAVGHPRGWAAADALLPVIESMRWHPAPRREAGQRVAGTLGGSSQSGGFRTTDLDNSGAFIPVVSPALKARDYKGPSSDGDGDGAPLIAHALRAMGHAGSHANGGGQVAVAVADTLGVGANQTTGFESEVVAVDVYNQTIDGPVAATLNAESGAPNHSGPKVMHAMQVRRLTPVECERLQGFPDGWTAIPWRGKPASECPDGPRYKSLGNSMAVPCMSYIGERIEAVTKALR